MIKKLLGIVCILTLSIYANGQNNLIQTNSPFKIGGNIGLNFGNTNYFGVGIYPMIGYQVTPNLLTGTTFGYTYQKNDYYKNNLFSGGPFANYTILPSIFTRIHLDYYNGTRELNYDGIDSYKIDDEETALWLGGGYQSSGRIGFQIGVMYNVLYDEDDSIFESGFNTFSGVVFAL